MQSTTRALQAGEEAADSPPEARAFRRILLKPAKSKDSRKSNQNSPTEISHCGLEAKKAKNGLEEPKESSVEKTEKSEFEDEKGGVLEGIKRGKAGKGPKKIIKLRRREESEEKSSEVQINLEKGQINLMTEGLSSYKDSAPIDIYASKITTNSAPIDAHKDQVLMLPKIAKAAPSPGRAKKKKKIHRDQSLHSEKLIDIRYTFDTRKETIFDRRGHTIEPERSHTFTDIARINQNQSNNSAWVPIGSSPLTNSRSPVLTTSISNMQSENQANPPVSEFTLDEPVEKVKKPPRQQIRLKKICASELCSPDRYQSKTFDKRDEIQDAIPQKSKSPIMEIKRKRAISDIGVNKSLVRQYSPIPQPTSKKIPFEILAKTFLFCQNYDQKHFQAFMAEVRKDLKTVKRMKVPNAPSNQIIISKVDKSRLLLTLDKKLLILDLDETLVHSKFSDKNAQEKRDLSKVDC